MGFSLGGSFSKSKGKSSTAGTFTSNTKGTATTDQNQTSFSQALQDSISQSQAQQATSGTKDSTQQSTSTGQTSTASQASSQASTTGAKESTAVQTTTQFDAQSKGVLDSLVGSLSTALNLSGSTVPQEYSKSQALLDSTAIFEDALQKSAEEIFPQLIDLQNKTGTFSNTTAQLLRDKQVTAAAREASKLRVDVISSYADISAKQQGLDQAQTNQVLQGLLSGLGLESGAVQTSATTGTEATSEKQAAVSQEQQLQLSQQQQAVKTQEQNQQLSISEEVSKQQVSSTEQAEQALKSTVVTEEDVNQSGTSTTKSKGSSAGISGAFK